MPYHDPCQACQCNAGNLVCATFKCPDLPPDCHEPVVPPGECCAQCSQICHHDGHSYQDGDVIPASDKCQQCRCVQSEVECSRVPCAPLGPCRSMMVPEGDCCPVCADCGQWPNKAIWNEGVCVKCTCKVFTHFVKI